MDAFANLTADTADISLESRHGDGISRPVPGEAAHLHALCVSQPGVGLMKVMLMAESPDKALVYAHARWPNAVVTLG
jgi:hypothetical protein